MFDDSLPSILRVEICGWCKCRACVSFARLYLIQLVFKKFFFQLSFAYSDKVQNSLFLVEIKNTANREIDRHIFSGEIYTFNHDVRNILNLFFIKLNVFIFLIFKDFDASLVNQECKDENSNKFVIFFIFIKFSDKVFFMAIHSLIIFFSRNYLISWETRKWRHQLLSSLCVS